MLVRKIEKDIDEWIRNGRNAFLVKGVRQCGKTFTIHECLKRSGMPFLEFNLKEKEDILEILRDENDIDNLYIRLDAHLPEVIKPGTIIFLDEVQVYMQILSKIKALVEDGRFRYVLSGSYLGVERIKLEYVPVGYLDEYTMYPLDFEEFLININKKDSIIKYLRRHFDECQPVPNSTHNRVMNLLRLYLVVGGMPAVVDGFIKDRNLDNAAASQSMILAQYKVDFTQYEDANKKLGLSSIYELIPSELKMKNKRFTLADTKKGAEAEIAREPKQAKKVRYDTIKDSFVWLWESGNALPCFNVEAPAVSLEYNKKASLFKLFMSDVGLLTSSLGKAAKDMILNKVKSLNCGAIYENFVAQELTAHGYPLYYYNSSKFGELDFVIEYHNRVLPIEVKSGSDYDKHSALNNVLNTKEYAIDNAIVLADCNIYKEGKVTYMPAYMIMFLTDNVNLGTVNLADYIITDIPEE